MIKFAHKFISALLLVTAFLASGTAAAVTTICAEDHNSQHTGDMALRDMLPMSGMNHGTMGHNTMSHADTRNTQATLDCLIDCIANSACMDAADTQEAVRATIPAAKQVIIVAAPLLVVPKTPLPEINQHPPTAPPTLQPLSLHTLRVLLLI